MEQLRAIKFPDYSQHFLTKFLSVIDFVGPIRTVRAKSNTKPWFIIDVLNAIRNRDKQFKKFKRSGRETVKDNFKCVKLFLKKVINSKKKLFFEEKIAENRDNPKEFWRTLKSLGMPSKGRMQSKMLK